MTDLRQLIIDDMKPALGVTEPAAIALRAPRPVRCRMNPLKKSLSASIPAYIKMPLPAEYPARQR